MRIFSGSSRVRRSSDIIVTCWASTFQRACCRDRLRVSQASCSAPSTCAPAASDLRAGRLEAVAARLVAAILAGVEQVDLGEVAVAHRPVRGQRAEARHRRATHRHMLVPGLQRHRAAGAEQLRRRAVRVEILDPIVGDLVVVERMEESVRGMGALQVRVRLVEPVALPIVGEVERILADAAARRDDQAAAPARPRRVAAILVDVVAIMIDEGEVLARQMAVGGIEAVLVTLAAGDPELERLGSGAGGGGVRARPLMLRSPPAWKRYQ